MIDIDIRRDAGLMQNEKMKILKMLEDKKITAEDAAKLLDSISDAPQKASEKRSKPELSEDMPDIPSPPKQKPQGSKDYSYSDDRSNEPGKGYKKSDDSYDGKHKTEDLANDLGKKFEAFAREMEPKIKKITETVAEKVAQGADKLHKSLSSESKHTPPPTGSQYPGGDAAHKTDKKTTSPANEKNFEMIVNEGYNELSLAGVNGNVRVKGYNGDKLSATVKFKQKRKNASIELMKLGGKYFLKYEDDDYESISIDAYVPERMFDVIKICGVNGNMDISSLAAKDMELSNLNGQTSLSMLGAKTIKGDFTNGRLRINKINADNAIFENLNGSVEAEEIDIATLSLTNYNGGLSCLVSSFDKYNDYIWSLETSNAKLSLNLPTLPDLGYHIKAHTTMGDIKVGLTSMQFIENNQTLVEARSINFDKAEKKVKLALETSNAPLMVN